jgi:hypothetical protein
MRAAAGKEIQQKVTKETKKDFQAERISFHSLCRELSAKQQCKCAECLRWRFCYFSDLRFLRYLL